MEIPLPPCHLHLSSCIGTEVMLRTGMTNPPHIMQHLDKVTWQLGEWVFWRNFCRIFWVLPLTFSDVFLFFLVLRPVYVFVTWNKQKEGGLWQIKEIIYHPNISHIPSKYIPYTIQIYPNISHPNISQYIPSKYITTSKPIYTLQFWHFGVDVAVILKLGKQKSKSVFRGSSGPNNRNGRVGGLEVRGFFLTSCCCCCC